MYFIALQSAVSIIISMGASHGRLTPIQIGVLGLMESFFWSLMFALNYTRNVIINFTMNSIQTPEEAWKCFVLEAYSDQVLNNNLN
jgi:hypothetical protein